MIRIRKTDGSTTIVPDGMFVEVTAETGEVAMVFFQASPGVVIQIKPGTVDAHRYEQMFAKLGVKFNRIVATRKT